MVKIKLGMSTDSSEGESGALAAVRDKLKIQQRLIDISVRSLLSCRSSSADLSQSLESQSALEVQRENIGLIETRLMKYFSRQLLVKREFLRQFEGDGYKVAEREIDALIDLNLFLNVVDMEPRSIQQLTKEDQLCLDALFAMAPHDLHSLMVRLGLSLEEEEKLMTSLRLLAACYNQLEKEPTNKGFSYERYNSSSSRLSSVSTPGLLDERQDSISSSAASLVPAGSVFTLLSPRPYSTTTVTSSPSLLSPALPPSSPLVPNGGGPYHSTPVPRPSTPTPHSPVLSRNTSLSSSVLYQDSETHEGGSAEGGSRLSSLVTPQSNGGRSSLNKIYTHSRSHSNPHAHLIALDGEPHRSTASPAPPPPETFVYRSPSPPHRASSQSSVATQGNHGSPGAIQRRPHLHMRRHHPPPSSLHTASGEQLAPESPVQRSSAYSSSQYDYPVRSNSVTYMYNERRTSSMSYQSHGRPSVEGGPRKHLVHGASTSMVDLPNNYAASTEHLGDIEEYPLSSNATKSQSVPRLTLLTISSENDKNGSTSVPTSPRTPGTYTPTGHMGHAIKHRFTAKTFLTPHVCAVCKKTMMFGVRCKHCSYRCHKGCAEKAPHSCGLPQELMNFFRQQFHKKGSTHSFDGPSSSEPYATRPSITRGHTYDADTRDPAEEEFIIHELSKEPIKGQYSPVMSLKKSRHGPAYGHRPYTTQQSSTSLLEVPVSRSHHHGGYHSISSSPSPSSSPPTSPSLSPSTPRSPRSPYPSGHNYPYSKILICTDDSENESYEGEAIQGRGLLSGSQSPASYASKDSITDIERMQSVSPKGLRPPPQVVPAHSLPDLLLGHKSVESSEGSSVDSTGGYHHPVHKKESTVSATESHASTLVNSIPSQAEEEDGYSESCDSSQGIPEEYAELRMKHRNSVIDEWNIPYDEVRIVERMGRGPLGEVSRGYWHGQVAVKTFCLDETASQRHLQKFKEEVLILKKTRHHNLALFMGASFTLPNLAIITSFCHGNTLHKHLHVWSETFSIEKCYNVAKQVATGMGYLHARGIVHKGLHTRNIFLDKDKVVITDTGLSSVSDSLCFSNRRSKCAVIVPRTKLYYLAPELMREISCAPDVLETGDVYHYTEKTDIYAFGTVFYELLTRRYPFASLDATGFPLDVTMVIYQVGRGSRQDITSRDAPKKIKDLIWECWQLDPKKRIPFSTIWDIITKVSRKKTPISRSPSVPTALSRSSEDLLRLALNN